MHSFFLIFLCALSITNIRLWLRSSTELTLWNAPKNIGDQVCVCVCGTSPFNFLKTFQHLFCTLTYANSKGHQWLGSHFRPSMEPESSSAVKWERRSAVWKWISLAEIREPSASHARLQWGKITAVQIVFGTLSTCYFISQMENNNTGSGVGTTTALWNVSGSTHLVLWEFVLFPKYAK